MRLASSSNDTGREESALGPSQLATAPSLLMPRAAEAQDDVRNVLLPTGDARGEVSAFLPALREEQPRVA